MSEIHTNQTKVRFTTLKHEHNFSYTRKLIFNIHTSQTKIRLKTLSINIIPVMQGN